MRDETAGAAAELGGGGTVWAGALTLMALIAACGLWVMRSDPLAAALFAVVLVATGLVAWFAARVTARATREVTEAEARLRAAAEALPDGLVVCDRNDRIVFYNSRYPAHMTEPLRRALKDRQELRGVPARGPRQRPGLPPGDGRGLPRPAAGAADRQPQRACPPHRRRPLGADPREPRRRRRPGAAHHRHQRRAAARGGAAPARPRGRAGGRPGGDHRARPWLHLRQPRLRDHHRLQPGRGARPPAAGGAVERPASAGVLRGDAPRARLRPGLARHHRQPPPRRPPDRAGDHHRAAARRDRRHHALCRGQARRHRGPRPGARAGRERGALPGGGRHAGRVHPAGQPGRRLDLHERRGGAARRHDAGRGAGARPPRPGLHHPRGPAASSPRIWRASPRNRRPARSSSAPSIRTAGCTGRPGPTPASSTPTAS